jgi:hypothetical protein
MMRSARERTTAKTDKERNEKGAKEGANGPEGPFDGTVQRLRNGFNE